MAFSFAGFGICRYAFAYQQSFRIDSGWNRVSKTRKTHYPTKVTDDENVCEGLLSRKIPGKTLAESTSRTNLSRVRRHLEVSLSLQDTAEI